ncbi:hypothetical protein LTR62_007903 [Meristemomyces frigidus]|uniref:DUF726-domain-containing protein n=1 Tax=Meristemomyces frigidus TaxID=1508187 RepID=A0AAN7TH89_9PEZI|nr:hypothetical protein LTR62_007903 [Meristemomyces frigidus]
MASLFSKATRAFSSGSPAEQVKQGDEEGDSLITILKTDDDRSALTILVADCTEFMRQNIIDIFEAKQTGKSDDLVATPLTGDQALTNLDVDPGTVDVAAQDKAKKDLAQRQEKMRKELEQREKELSGPRMQELKSAALHFFDAWRTSVITRVGEIVNSKETAKQQKQHADPKPMYPERQTGRVRHHQQPQYDPSVDDMMKKLYLPVKNPLTKLPEAQRALILHSVLLLLLSLEHYQSHSRTLLLYVSTSLELDVSILAQDESKIARGLLTAADNLKADEETKKKAEANQDSRKWKVGLATVAGAALIGVTGGLAAPLLAAGVGSMMGGLGLGATAAAGYLGTLAGSTVIVGGLFGAYGGRMTGKMMDQYAREVEDFGFVPVRDQHKPRKIEKEYRRLRVAIGISGWLSNKDEVVAPWKVIGTEMETFALRFELEALMNLGNSMSTMVTSAAWGYAKSEIIKRTVFASLMAGLWPLALLKVSRVIDNPWSVASYRAQKAGEVLADALINKAQGERPVTLIGYSLGAKVIYVCLQILAERKAFGLVESAIMIGTPSPSTAADWRQVRSVVSGRVVNTYSTKDYILAFLYRSSSIQYGVAGLQAIENVKGVENVDVSDLVTGHNSYRFLTGTILQRIGFEDVDASVLAKEQQELKAEEAKEEKELQASEKAEQAKAPPAKALQQSKLDEAPAAVKDALHDSKSEAPEVSDQYVKELESEIERKNQQSYISWAQEGMVSAGSTAAVAYEKAKAQWALRRQGTAGNAAAGTAAQADTARKDINHAAGDAGVEAPAVGTAAYQGMKARSLARKEVGSGAPTHVPMDDSTKAKVA